MAASWWSWALLCLILASRYTNIFADSLVAEDVATTVGMGANLTCSFHSNAAVTSVELYINKSMGDISTFVLQEVDTSIHLLITAAALTDAGGYECVAIVDNTTINKTFYLQVNEVPQLMVAVQNITAVVGDITKLPCTVYTNINTSSSQLDVMITSTTVGDLSQSTSVVANGPNSIALVISNVKLSDSGEYQCLATVKGLTAQDTFHLIVLERLLVSVTPTSQSVSLGVDATFSCNASATAVTYLWLKNDQPIVPNIKASSLVLRNVTYFDMATYSCVVMLGNQRVTASASLRINEYRAPFIIGNPEHFNAIDSADTLVVNCDVMGSPPPSFVWEKSNVAVQVLTIRPNHYSGPYVATNGSLMLMFAAPSDSGIYICYGLDPVTKVNVSSSYHITIHLTEVIWTTWYFFVIYGVVALFLTMIFLLLCYFCASILDICSCKTRRKRRMKMNSQQIDQSGWPWLDTIQMDAPNLAYEMNFGDKHSLLPQPRDDDLVLDNSLETSNKQHRQATKLPEPPTADEVTVPEITVEQYDAHEEDRIIQEEDSQPKVKKNKKEKKAKKNITEPTTDLFLY